MSTQVTYTVKFTPLISEGTYGTEVDVSDDVFLSAVGEITQQLDAQDYDFGSFSFSSLGLDCNNFNGRFNDENDYRSIFTFKRDLCRVEVTFIETTITRDSNGIITGDSETTKIVFRGLINEEATRDDFESDRISFLVLSRDSVIRNTKVTKSAIADGTNASDAVITILSNDTISNTLVVDATNITLDTDYVIDVGSEFDDLTSWDALKNIMLTSNSILTINDSDEIFIKSRDENNSLSTINLFGPYDEYGRTNIIRIENYNTGRHRMFNSIKSGDLEVSDDGFVEDFGLRQKEFNTAWITTNATTLSILNALLSEFKAPKLELEVFVDTKAVEDAQLLQNVSINYPPRTVPDDDTFLPIVGDSQYSDSDTPYPEEIGSVSISENVKFKIIQISHDVENFVTRLKLRQAGTGIGDGYFA